MFNFLDKTPGWLIPYGTKVNEFLPGAGSYLWSGIKSMTYSFTVTMIMTRGDYVKGFKSVGNAAGVELLECMFYTSVISKIDIPGVSNGTKKIGTRVANFCLYTLEARNSIDLKVSAAATIIPFILSKVCHAPGLMVYGLIKV